MQNRIKYVHRLCLPWEDHMPKRNKIPLPHDNLLKAFQMDTSRYDLLSEAAVSMMKLKKYDKAIEDYNQKIASEKRLFRLIILILGIVL